MNLTINATEAAPSSSTVLLSAGSATMNAAELERYQHGSKIAPGEYVWFEVSNSGLAIEPAVVEKMFDPFFSTKGDGRGLGLAAVLGIVRKHSGALRVQPWVGHESGTCIQVLLPVAHISRRTPPSTKILGDQTNTNSEQIAHNRSSYILLVDDDPMVREVARRFLESAGYPTLEADSGSKALEILADTGEQISLVILDVVMPDMNGPETWQRIQRRQPAPPVLFISGHPRGHLDNLMGNETANYLEKPFNRTTLLRQITALAPPKAVVPSNSQ